MRQNVLDLCTSAQRQAVSEGLRLMQNRAFFAAHERFEEGFRSADGSARELLRGLTQLAASQHQMALGRGRAAVRTWQKARARLAPLGVVDAAFCAAMDALHARAGITAEGPRFFDPGVLGPDQRVPRLALETL